MMKIFAWLLECSSFKASENAVNGESRKARDDEGG